MNDAKEPNPARPVSVQPVVRSAPEIRPTALSTCLRVAIDDMIDARDYVATKQLAAGHATWEDVRAIAITYFIQRSKS